MCLCVSHLENSFLCFLWLWTHINHYLHDQDSGLTGISQPLIKHTLTAVHCVVIPEYLYSKLKVHFRYNGFLPGRTDLYANVLINLKNCVFLSCKFVDKLEELHLSFMHKKKIFRECLCNSWELTNVFLNPQVIKKSFPCNYVQVTK